MWIAEYICSSTFSRPFLSAASVKYFCSAGSRKGSFARSEKNVCAGVQIWATALVLGITAMQKLLGKARLDELLTAYIEKPQGKPTLVPENDKRPAMNTAKNDFMEENIDE